MPRELPNESVNKTNAAADAHNARRDFPARVELTRGVLDAIEAHARAEAPRECCGLLVGRHHEHPTAGGGAASLVIERAVATRNLAPEPTRYLIDPADHFRLLRELRAVSASAAPDTIVGAYHSHPGSPPVPSATDLANDLGGASPHFLYVIVSPRRGGEPGSETRAWWLVDGNFREIPIVPVA